MERFSPPPIRAGPSARQTRRKQSCVPGFRCSACAHKGRRKSSTAPDCCKPRAAASRLSEVAMPSSPESQHRDNSARAACPGRDAASGPPPQSDQRGDHRQPMTTNRRHVVDEVPVQGLSSMLSAARIAFMSGMVYANPARIPATRRRKCHDEISAARAVAARKSGLTRARRVPPAAGS